jgi:hypothetical protein
MYNPVKGELEQYIVVQKRTSDSRLSHKREHRDPTYS